MSIYLDPRPVDLPVVALQASLTAFGELLSYSSFIIPHSSQTDSEIVDLTMSSLSAVDMRALRRVQRLLDLEPELLSSPRHSPISASARATPALEELARGP
jgi:hypothetical protein